MTIARKMIDGSASLEEIKYLLFLALTELQGFDPNCIVIVDPAESFSVNAVLDLLELSDEADSE